MYTTYHPPRRKGAILYRLLAIWSLLFPRVTCQFTFPTLPPTAAIFTTRANCRAFYNECMDTFRTCLRFAGPNNSVRQTCEDWRSRICEDMIRVGCDVLPNEVQTVGGGTLGGGTLGTRMMSSNGLLSVPTSSNTCTLGSTATASLPSISFPSLSDSTSSILAVPTPTPTQAFPPPTAPPIIPPTFFSSFTTVVITSTITTIQTFTTGTSIWTATMTRTTTTTERRGLNFTVISNDSTRPWCRAGIGVGFLFWGVIGWACCLI